MKIQGTREWAVATVDCCTGCSHGCKYCYACRRAVYEGEVPDRDSWLVPKIRMGDIEKKYPLYDGRVMFPASHDIEPQTVDDCLIVLSKLLQAGNSVLVVSKPHLDCIQTIAHTFSSWKRQLLFRFTITAMNENILSFWEPGAPLFEERVASLSHMYSKGYETSVSIEPMLESNAICKLVDTLQPYVSHSIWIGKMNKIQKRVDTSMPGMYEELLRIRKGQTDERIWEIYNLLRNNSLVKWKESIKKVVGIPPAEMAGLDI